MPEDTPIKKAIAEIEKQHEDVCEKYGDPRECACEENLSILKRHAEEQDFSLKDLDECRKKAAAYENYLLLVDTGEITVITKREGTCATCKHHTEPGHCIIWSTNYHTVKLDDFCSRWEAKP